MSGEVTLTVGLLEIGFAADVASGKLVQRSALNKGTQDFLVMMSHTMTLVWFIGWVRWSCSWLEGFKG
jgi:hypothetical protein